jgi:hypothetical protein
MEDKIDINVWQEEDEVHVMLTYKDANTYLLYTDPVNIDLLLKNLPYALEQIGKELEQRIDSIVTAENEDEDEG